MCPVSFNYLTFLNYSNIMLRISNTNSNSFIAVLSQTWKRFWQRTDISGMTNAREAQSSLRMKIWMVLFAVFSLLTISAMYHVFHDYSLHPVTTSITVRHQNQVVKKHIKTFKFLEILKIGHYHFHIYLTSSCTHILDTVSSSNNMQSK